MQQHGWLHISTEGFAAFNKARPKQHLVKELVQNALDAVADGPGVVELDWSLEAPGVRVSCRDTGSGVYDLSAMRVVYLTTKQDSHLRRGRFGRGFKEILSVAAWARVASGAHAIEFTLDNGEKVSRSVNLSSPVHGTQVDMAFDWTAEDIADFDTYFGAFLTLPEVIFRINGRRVETSPPAYTIDAQLATEIYFPESQSWKRPRRKTTIELVPTREAATPFIYELGIPVAPAEWDLPYHANIAQRVPMNPNRDALASGYARRVHAAVLPHVLPDLEAEAATADWVGAAGTACAPEVQAEIVTRAFGANAARAVPAMGKRDFDDDAERIGATIVKTGQMSAGFREMARSHLPTSKHVYETHERARQEAAAARGFAATDPAPDDPRAAWIAERGGAERVNRCLAFAVWFCQLLLDETAPHEAAVTGRLALGLTQTDFVKGGGPFAAAWSADNILTLSLEEDCFWDEPMGPATFQVLIHEAAHARNLHHGKSFVAEVERLAGVAAALMLERGADIHRDWADLA